MSCLETTADVYRQATKQPQVDLGYITNPVWPPPGLSIPPRMLSLSYGCGSTVNPGDLTNSPTVLVGVDAVSGLLDASCLHVQTAEAQNDWFKSKFIDLRASDILHLPVADERVDVAAQNRFFEHT